MMSLQKYHEKRAFSKTPEPRGRVARSKSGQRFVVQLHDASRLHYDFRLEIDGVLKSWAVPKGPSLDPSDKRLAVHVEDHPFDYASFEGVIPKGEYGGGTVIVWDQGEFEPIPSGGNLSKDYQQGKLKIVLHGQKLEGGFALVRMGKQDDKGKENWLLIKERDEFARGAEDYSVTQSNPNSVITGRRVDEVAKDPDKKWTKAGSENIRSVKKVAKKVSPAQRRKSIKTSLPEPFDVQLAKLTDVVPEGKGWIHEIKFDGYRLLTRLSRGSVEMMTRNHNDWTARFPELRQSLEDLGVESAILDGEVVAIRPDGLTNFQDLQNAFKKGNTDQLVFEIFDLLFINGEDLRSLPLLTRKKRLEELLGAAADPRLIYSDHIEKDGAEFLAQGCQKGLEGIISKRGDRPYRSGRSDDWLKIKCILREEFVIGGFTPPEGARQKFGALLLGSFNADGQLIYNGRVGTGFSDETLKEMHQRMAPLEVKRSPFQTHGSLVSKGVHWIKPQLVAQIEFANWTEDRVLRHPSFQGLREDITASSVVRDFGEVVMNPVSSAKGAGRGKTKTLAPRDEAIEQLKDVKLTSPDKELYPEVPLTKLDLVRYYASVADWILPHLKQRPLSLVRCPDGGQGTCFYQKHAAAGTPEELKRVMIKEKSTTDEYLVADDLPALASLVQISVLEIHPWGARIDKIEKPDRMFFDLDPADDVPWAAVRKGAFDLKEILDDLGLVSFVKTTGGKGLHIIVPLDRRHGWDDVKGFAEKVSKNLVASSPAKYTANMSKAARGGKIYIDYVRNNRGATAVAPYSTRARAGAPVATPLAWEELSTIKASNQFRVQNVLERLAGLKVDPWGELIEVRQSLTQTMKKKIGL
jgi:bifunctional non-homologous end joining protein LigD